MGTAYFSETLASSYESTGHRNPEKQLHSNRRENIKLCVNTTQSIHLRKDTFMATPQNNNTWVTENYIFTWRLCVSHSDWEKGCGCLGKIYWWKYFDNKAEIMEQMSLHKVQPHNPYTFLLQKLNHWCSGASTLTSKKWEENLYSET
jgi:hypothetical protein